MLALDEHTNLAAGVSTSGFAWKYPGRVGDSAVIGAGNYCDSRFGAAACIGCGDMAIRAATAHTGHAPSDRRGAAGGGAAGDVGPERLRGPLLQFDELRRALSPDGIHAAFSTLETATYVDMDTQSADVHEETRTHMPWLAGA